MVRVFSVAALVAVLIVSVAGAQPPGGQRGGGRGFGGGMQASPLMLLRIDEVRKELGLSDEQNKQVQELGEELRSSFGGTNFQELRDLSQEEREKRLAEIRTKAEEA